MHRRFVHGLGGVVVIAGLAACGASAQVARTSASAQPAPQPAMAAADVAGRVEIARSELLAVLDAGLGRFLGRVATEPAREGNVFLGFRVVSLDTAFRAADADVGVRDGDVIVRVNGQPIERPEQALAVWEGLRVASTLAIEYLRAGERREARFAIVD
jgi:type II secretory pathway component PulC